MIVGDKVVCIKTTISLKGNVGAVKGRLYFIRGIYKCTCGNYAFDVNINTPYDQIMRTQCFDCKAVHLWPEIWYQNKENFRPVVWDDCRVELINEALKEETEVEELTIKQD